MDGEGESVRRSRDDHLKDWNEALQIEGQTDWNGMHNDKMECV